MDRKMVARELGKIADLLTAMDPETKEQIEEVQDYEDLSNALDKELKVLESVNNRIGKWRMKRVWDPEVRSALALVVKSLDEADDNIDELRVMAANW